MIQKEVVINNQVGLHARPASLLVQTAMIFSSSINIIKDEAKIDAKSIMGIMMLAAACGTELVIQAEGPDEEAAINTLAELFAGGFGEEI